MYDEEEYIAAVLIRTAEARLPEGLTREIVVVDDGSGDGSAEAAEAAAARLDVPVKVLCHERNRGKGAAIRTALAEAQGEYVLIQDADLEYDPREYTKLLEPLVDGRADAVYGTRFAVGVERRVLYFWHALANKFLTGLVNLAADLNLTDVWTGYKAFRASLLKSIPLRSDGFGFEPEITIKLAQRQASVYETPIGYHGRTYEEGKKINKWDAVSSIGTVLRFAFTRDIYTESGPEILDTLSRAPRFNKWMAETIAPYVGKRALEIGAGIGNLSRHLAPRRERYVATDIDSEHLARLRVRLRHRPNFQAAPVDLTRAEDFESLEGQFDTVICLNVVEHVEDDGLALRNIHRALAPGGTAIVLVPEGMSIYGDLDRALGHYRRYSREELASKMSDAGFEVRELFEFNRATRPGWYLNGRLLHRRTFSRIQIWLFDHIVPLLRHADRHIPWKGVSLIAVGRRGD